MRFSLVSFALVALARLLVPGVHGAPAPVSDHAVLLELRQDTSSNIGLLGSLLEILQDLLGQVSGSLAPNAQKVVQEAEGLVGSAGLLRRALASGANSSTSSTANSTTTTTTTSTGLATGAVGSVPSVSQPSSKPPTRLGRQLPTSTSTSTLPPFGPPTSSTSAAPNQTGAMSSPSGTSTPGLQRSN